MLDRTCRVDITDFLNRIVQYNNNKTNKQTCNQMITSEDAIWYMLEVGNVNVGAWYARYCQAPDEATQAAAEKLSPVHERRLSRQTLSKIFLEGLSLPEHH